MKQHERQEARDLRKKGLSMREISEVLHVAKSSVSLWTRDIMLSSLEKERISNRAYKVAREKVALHNREQGRLSRLEYRKLGYHVDSREFDCLCMMYWGEGSKSRNILQFSNSDSDMILYYWKIVMSFFNPIKNNVNYSFAINCYTDIHSVNEIETYWMGILKEPCFRFTKTQVNKVSRASLGKRHKLCEWGTLRISVFSTKYVQMVYGRICAMSGKSLNYWE